MCTFYRKNKLGVQLTKLKRKKFRLQEYIRNPFCFWCGEWMLLFCNKGQFEDFATIEHLKPICEGGKDEDVNLRLVHKRCNK